MHTRLTLIVSRLVEGSSEDDIVLQPCQTLHYASGDPHTLMVSFCTHDSCAAYAIPPSLGRLTNEPGPDGM